jgi:hypothetical protein
MNWITDHNPDIGIGEPRNQLVQFGDRIRIDRVDRSRADRVSSTIRERLVHKFSQIEDALTTLANNSNPRQS